MDKHTQGKLELAENPLEIIGGGMDIAFCGPAKGFNMDEYPVRRANARRLVACWNACEGISTETLENGNSIQVALMGGLNAALECDRLLAENARLREALEDMVELRDLTIAGRVNPDKSELAVVANARKLIAP